MTREEMEKILAAPEGARLEFKEARRRYDFDELVRYCVALANEGGGKVVLGVTDVRPRRVVGTSAFPEPGRTEAGIYERVGRRVMIEEVFHADGRVLVIHIPSRTPGSAWNDRGTYWMRDFLVLNSLQQEEEVPEALRDRLPRLGQLGIVESVGRGRGTRFFLSRRFYAALGRRGSYTRQRGLDREERKALLLRHLRGHAGEEGIPLAELQQVLPTQSRFQINSLLNELREEGLVRLEGQRRWARWFPMRQS